MKTGFRLCCITKNRTNPAYRGARVGARRTAEILGCELFHLTPARPDDATDQAALLSKAIDRAPDAILIAVAHPTALNPVLEKAVAADIALVFFVSRAEGIPARAFVTSDNHALAFGVADHLIRAIGGAGNLAIMEGSPTSATSAPRTQGFLSAAAAYPGIDIVERRRGNYQREDARRAMADMLGRRVDIDGVLSANDFMALGIIDALDAARCEAAVAGVNAMPDAIKAIRAGKMRATAAYDAMKMACVATEAAVRSLSGLPVPERIDLPVEIVDADNRGAWDRPYEERPLPRWDKVVGDRPGPTSGVEHPAR